MTQFTAFIKLIRLPNLLIIALTQYAIRYGIINTILTNSIYKNIDLKLDGASYNGPAIINFVSEDSTKTIVYPDVKSTELSEGDYNVSVYIYQNSSLKLEKTTYEQCVDIPRGVIGGAFGLTKKKCFNVDLPSQVVSSALSGGGKDVYYMTEYELKNLGDLEIDAESLPKPDSLDALQENYALFETKGLNIFFK